MKRTWPATVAPVLVLVGAAGCGNGGGEGVPERLQKVRRGANIDRVLHASRVRLRIGTSARGVLTARVASTPRSAGAPLTRAVKARSVKTRHGDPVLKVDATAARSVPRCDPLYLIAETRTKGRVRRRAVSRLAQSATCRQVSSRGTWHPTSRPPIDPAMGNIPFGTRSHWLQPWRSYLDTFPASRLRDAIGINFNVGSAEPWSDGVLRLLARSGVRRARMDVSWNSMQYDHPDRLTPHVAAVFGQALRTMRKRGIRPLVLLNSSAGGPAPSQPVPLTLTRPAKRGARMIFVDPQNVSALVPGRSGIDAPRLLAGTLVKAALPGGVVTLTKPLQTDLPAGRVPASTLRFAPFGGQSTDTLDGWLSYADSVTQFTKKVLGPGNFDVEIWNELSSNSGFIPQSAYYNPLPAGPQPDTVDPAAPDGGAAS